MMLRLNNIGNKRKYILFACIVILAAALRFYKLPEMAGYEFDQEYAVNFAYSVLRDYPVRLIGQGLSVQGLFMGPWYFYYLVPFYAASNLHPIGGYVGSILFGLIIIVAYFFVGRSLFSEKVGFIVAFFRAILMPKIIDDWTLVPAAHCELIVLLTWLCFYKYWHGQLKYLPLLGLLFGLYTSIHPILFPFYLVFIVLFFIKRRIPDIKTIMLSIVAFIIPLIPLILFEYWHNFLEVKRLIEIFDGGGGTITLNALQSLPKYLKLNLYDSFAVFGVEGLYKNLLFITFITATLIFIIKRVDFWKDNFHKISLLITYLTFLTYYIFFPTHVSEYYFTGLATLFLLYITATLSILTPNVLGRAVLIFFLTSIALINFSKLIGSWNNPALTTLYHKDFIVQEVLKRQPRDQEFYVSYITYPGWNFGFDYLFKYYGHTPQTREARSPIYTIVIPRSLSSGSIDISSGNIGLILPKLPNKKLKKL